jgi:sucrose-6F-phosphate phosphohydrolase
MNSTGWFAVEFSTAYRKFECMPLKLLATDLDGTYLPQQGDNDNVIDLQILQGLLRDWDVQLAYVTGRHFDSVVSAMRDDLLRSAEWIICNVGTQVMIRENSGQYQFSRDYHETLRCKVQNQSIQCCADELIRWPGLQCQESEKQGEFKLSFYAKVDELVTLCSKLDAWLIERKLPYKTTHSIDPSGEEGLIDLLPEGVDKAFAIHWIADRFGLSTDDILFCGDSGNDRAALMDKFRGVLVSNAHPDLKDQVHRHHHGNGTQKKLFSASKPATSGVLEGVRHFLHHW